MTTHNSEWKNMQFGVRRSIRYHRCRQRFFQKFGFGCDLIAAGFGTSAAAAILASLGKPWELGAASIGAFGALLGLIVKPDVKALEYARLAERFIVLEKKMALITAPSATDLSQCDAERLEIERSEPPALRVLDVICHNEEVRARGHGVSELADVKGFQRLTCQLFDWNAHKLDKAGPKF